MDFRDRSCIVNRIDSDDPWRRYRAWKGKGKGEGEGQREGEVSAPQARRRPDRARLAAHGEGEYDGENAAFGGHRASPTR